MEFRLDHFKLYEVQPYSGGGATPELRGQFDSRDRPFVLNLLRQFANPVSKNGEGIKDRNNHLTAYEISTTAPEPQRAVVVDNQFGRQKMKIGPVHFLLVPALKIEPGIGMPENLDHFKCYKVLESRPLDIAVSLEDQFDSESKVQVWEPVLFGVPTLKKYGGKTYEIKNPKEHLTIYRITDKKYSLARDVQDQFQKVPIQLAIFRSASLAVPSLKLEWERI